MTTERVQPQNFEMTAGDTKPIVIDVIDQDDVAVDLTGGSGQLVFAASKGDAPFFTKVGVLAGNPNNRIRFVVDPADTALLAGAKYWEAEYVDASGRISTIAFGTVNILRQSIT